ncbi:hypothetical protein SAMN05216293_1224 [Flagellimonas taeanensis]|uniref:Uncharacterized protein n=1 Tax=Flagellimonas taeanensis TaxID=1005926 RepID=A0A1M6T585_9FLAO|nr:hypothetical protein SAMN05216293_1224 [Allomuricauda taeanensis]
MKCIFCNNVERIEKRIRNNFDKKFHYIVLL